MLTMDVDNIFLKFTKEISNYTDGWRKNRRKRNARMAVALGLINDVSEFYPSFTLISTPKNKKKNSNRDNKYWRDRWIKWANASKKMIDASKEVDFMLFVKDGDCDFNKVTQRVMAICRRDENSMPFVESTHKYARSTHSQITRKEWGSPYRPARNKR